MRAAFGVKGGAQHHVPQQHRGRRPARRWPTPSASTRRARNPPNENVASTTTSGPTPRAPWARTAAAGNDFSDGAPVRDDGPRPRPQPVLERRGGHPARRPGGPARRRRAPHRRRPAAQHEPGGHRAAALERQRVRERQHDHPRRSSCAWSTLYGAIPAGSPGHNQADPGAGARRRHPGQPAQRSRTWAPSRSRPRPRSPIADVTVTEGDAGSTPAVFTVSLLRARRARPSPCSTPPPTARPPRAPTTSPPRRDRHVRARAPSPAGLRPRPGRRAGRGRRDLHREPVESHGRDHRRRPGPGHDPDNDPLPFLVRRRLRGRSRATRAHARAPSRSLLAPVSGRTVTVELRHRRRHGDRGQRLHGRCRDARPCPRARPAGRIAVSVLGDAAVEPDEGFSLNLSAPANATLGRRPGARAPS